MNIFNSLGSDNNLNILNINNNNIGSDDLELQFNSGTSDLTLYDKEQPVKSSVVNLQSLKVGSQYALTINKSTKTITLTNLQDATQTTTINLINLQNLELSGPTLLTNIGSQSGFGYQHMSASVHLTTYIGAYNATGEMAAWLGTQTATPLYLYTGNQSTGPSIRVGTGKTINFYQNQLKDIATPTENNDAATKAYVDANNGGSLPLTGGNMTGNISFNAYNGLSGTFEIIHDAGNIRFTSQGDNQYMQIGNASVDGNFIISGIPSGVQPVKNNLNSIQIYDAILKLYENMSMNNNTITDLADPIDLQDAVTKKFVDENYLFIGGGTMEGPINLGNNKITNLKTPLNNSDAATKSYVDSKTGGAQYLPLTGGTMAGPLNMNNYKINNVGDPTLENMAANKSYVDSKIIQPNKIINFPIVGNTWSNADPINHVGKSIKFYIPDGGPLLADEWLNNYYITNNEYLLLTTLTQNPSLFYLYGVCYKPSADQIAAGHIKKGSFTINLNIPCLLDKEWNTNTQMLLCQCILGENLTIIGSNKQVKCVACTTVNVANYVRKSNSYGKAINPPSGYSDKMQAVDIAVTFNLLADYNVTSSTLLYIYLQFASANPTYSGYTNMYANYLSCDMAVSGTLVSSINGICTYIESSNNAATLNNNDIPTYPNLTAQQETTNYFYDNFTAASFSPVYTYTTPLNNLHNYAIKKISNTEENITLYYNGSNPAIFDDGNILLNNIFNCSIYIKTDKLTTSQNITIKAAFKNEDINLTLQDINLNLKLNNDNWNRYNINFKPYDFIYLTALIINIPAGLNCSIDHTALNYIDDSGKIQDKNIFFKITGDNSILHFTEPDEIEDLTQRLKILEDYINLFKLTYDIIE
jgi:hypothetical protein